MTIRKLIRLFTPPIVGKIKRRFLKKSRKDITPSSLPQIEHHSETMYILGNGPSLNVSIEKYGDLLKSSDCIVVNYFALTDYYELIKPRFYALADPAFFSGESPFKLTVKKLIDKIITKTTWQLFFIIPQSAYNGDHGIIKKILKENNNISILLYNDNPNSEYDLPKFELWNRNISIPTIQTVINLSIYLSLYWNYKETYLLGVDTSFISNLRVNQDNNKLYSVETHFYNNDDIYEDKQIFDETKMRYLDSKLWEELECITRVFKSFHEINQFALYKGLKVFNASEYSWIDAFERKKPKTCLKKQNAK